MKYSTHAWSWTPIWSNDSLHLIDPAKELGFDALEIPLIATDKVDAAATRARAEAVGIDILCAVACLPQTDPASEDEETRGRALEYLKERLRLAADIGSRVVSGVTYSVVGRRSLPSEEQWERAVDVLRKAARYGREIGVTLGIEAVNRHETSLVNTAQQALAMKEETGEPNVGVHLDSFHMNMEELSLYDATVAAIPHLCHFHLCDSHRREVGTGLVDFDAIFRAFAEGGYDGPAGLEIFAPVMAPAEGARWGAPVPIDGVLSRSLAYLRGVESRHIRR